MERDLSSPTTVLIDRVNTNRFLKNDSNKLVTWVEGNKFLTLNTTVTLKITLIATKF